MLLWQIAGLLLSMAGIFLLYSSWRGSARNWLLVIGGWGALLASVLAWGQTSGVDKGAALGVVTITLTALAGVTLAALLAPVKERRAPRSRAPAATVEVGSWGTILSMALNILAVVLIGFVVAIAACTALFMLNRALGIEHTGNLALTMFAFPIIWAMLATFIGYSQSIAFRISVLTGIVAISTIILFATMQGG